MHYALFDGRLSNSYRSTSRSLVTQPFYRFVELVAADKIIQCFRVPSLRFLLVSV